MRGPRSSTRPWTSTIPFVVLSCAIAYFFGHLGPKYSPKLDDGSSLARGPHEKAEPTHADWSLRQLKPRSEGDTLPDESLHVALIFDENRRAYANGVIRSAFFYTRSQAVHFHLVAPRDLHGELRSQLEPVAGARHLSLYDYGLCLTLVRPVMEFSKASVHTSAHCKVYLAYILPDTVERVLYLDNDVVVLDDLGACFGTDPIPGHDEALMSMAVDMGDACQRRPNRCWPLSLTFETTPGLLCGNVPSYFDPNDAQNGKCLPSGDEEPAQVNGGVMLLELGRMRNAGFRDLYMASTASHYLIAGRRRATWGEQDFLNAFFRLHPRSLRILHCGCNYQWSAVRRQAKCGRQRITIGHGWTGGVAAPSSDPFNRIFHYFLNNPEQLEAPPKADLISASSYGSPNVSAPLSVNVNCLQQDFACTTISKAPEYGSQVFILTRTAGRPHFFREMLDSVREQTYPHVKLIVVTDDQKSLAYLGNVDATLVPSLRSDFNPATACKQCGSGAPDADECAAAPPVGDPRRPAFLKCFCNTTYPMNRYMDTLHDKALADGRPGWILYLDDDNLLSSPTAISRLLLDVQHRDQLVLFRSRLARLTPSSRNYGTDRVVQGDIDASNFMFHSSHITKTAWSDLRCGDWRTATSLARQLEIKWSQVVPVMSHPLRSRAGGLGLKKDLDFKLTVVITSHQNNGFRPTWAQETLRRYTSVEYAGLVDHVVFIWNNPSEEFPGHIPPTVSVVRPSKNSLNNRWTEALPHIKTEVVLNVDDDIFVDRAGIICMLQFFDGDPSRLIAPFVRRHDGTAYNIDELLNNEPWSMALPRILVLSRGNIELYASHSASSLRDYVDLQEAHCDDIVLNAVVTNATRRAPLRVLLPQSSITDYYGKCFPPYRESTGGLGLQRNREGLRRECFSNIMSRFTTMPLRFTSLTGICGARGVKAGLTATVSKERWLSMISDEPCSSRSLHHIV